MQTLKVYQSLWGMELRSPGKAELSMRANFEKARDAGFAGLCIDLGADEVEQFREAGPLYEEFELGCMVNAFPDKVDNLVPVLNLAREFDARMVNVIGGVMPLAVEDAVPVVREWMRNAHDAGMPLLFETHRDSLLNDLYFTLQLMDAVPDCYQIAPEKHRELFGNNPENVVPLSSQLRIFHRQRVRRICDNHDENTPSGHDYLIAARKGEVYGGNAASFLTSF